MLSGKKRTAEEIEGAKPRVVQTPHMGVVLRSARMNPPYVVAMDADVLEHPDTGAVLAPGDVQVVAHVDVEDKSVIIHRRALVTKKEVEEHVVLMQADWKATFDNFAVNLASGGGAFSLVFEIRLTAGLMATETVADAPILCKTDPVELRVASSSVNIKTERCKMLWPGKKVHPARSHINEKLGVRDLMLATRQFGTRYMGFTFREWDMAHLFELSEADVASINAREMTFKTFNERVFALFHHIYQFACGNLFNLELFAGGYFTIMDFAVAARTVAGHPAGTFLLHFCHPEGAGPYRLGVSFVKEDGGIGHIALTYTRLARVGWATEFMKDPRLTHILRVSTTESASDDVLEPKDELRKLHGAAGNPRIFEGEYTPRVDVFVIS